jgi:hypothetical protein
MALVLEGRILRSLPRLELVSVETVELLERPVSPVHREVSPVLRDLVLDLAAPPVRV